MYSSAHFKVDAHAKCIKLAMFPLIQQAGQTLAATPPPLTPSSPAAISPFYHSDMFPLFN